MRVDDLLDIDWDRGEEDPCQRGTIGCPIDHSNWGPETECTTW
jgi:hypothetical protein